jgi:hypothetical protein
MKKIWKHKYFSSFLAFLIVMVLFLATIVSHGMNLMPFYQEFLDDLNFSNLNDVDISLLPGMNQYVMPDVLGTPYQDSVTLLHSLGVVKGYEDGTFRPDKKISRAEFITMGFKMLSGDYVPDSSTIQARFSDVPQEHWAYGFIHEGFAMGLLSGYPDGTFKPEQNISYIEALTIGVRMATAMERLNSLTNWPDDYYNEAARLNLTDGHAKDEPFDTLQTRGLVADILAKVYRIISPAFTP